MKNTLDRTGLTPSTGAFASQDLHSPNSSEQPTKTFPPEVPSSNPQKTASSGRFKYFRKGECPVCHGASRNCRQSKSTGLIHCRNANVSPTNFWFVGEDRLGFGMWRPADADATNNFSEKEAHRLWQQKSTNQRSERGFKKVLSSKVLSIEERDQQFKTVSRQSGSIAFRHQQQLQDRGLTPAQIEYAHQKGIFFSWQPYEKLYGVTPDLPGVDGQGRLRNFQGLAIGVPDAEGHILGLQIKPDRKQGYFWVSSESIGGNGIHLPNGETPIGFYQPQAGILRAETNLAEGFLKSYITSQLFGLIVIGAAGANFTSSPQLLEQYLAAAKALHGSNLVVLNPDSGSTLNRHIMRQYRNVCQCIEALGYEVRIRWWGQLHKAKGDPRYGDIDEIDEATFAAAQLLTIEAFEAIAAQNKTPKTVLEQILKLLERRYRRQKTKPIKQVAQPAEPGAIQYERGDRLLTWKQAADQGYRHILDLSGTGAGKSHDAGRMTPEPFDGQQVIYLSDQHRNPTVDTLSIANGWSDLEARHNGLVHEKTPDGTIRLKRARRGEAAAIAPNCSRVVTLNELREKNVSDADTAALICSTCPAKEMCQHAEGPGYGYLNQRRDALSSPKIRAHPDSLPDPDEYNLSQTVLIWDEPGQNLRVAKKIKVERQDLEAVIAQILQHADLLGQLQPVLEVLSKLFNGQTKIGRYGLGHQAISELFPQSLKLNMEAIAQALQPNLAVLNTTAEYGVDLSDLSPSLRKNFLEKDSTKAEQAKQHILKQWFVQFLQILLGHMPGGTVQFQHERLILTLPNKRHQTIAKSAKVNIFLDATLTRADLAQKLDCSPEEIFVCREKQPSVSNLKVTQVINMGRMGMQRGDHQKKQLAALVHHYQNIDPSTKVIDFKKFEADGAHWRDSRGVNYFLDTKTLILVGAPCPNLNEMLAEYSCLAQLATAEDEPEFQAWLNRRIQAEIQQEMGRLRANRRPNESLQVVLVTNFDFDTDLPVEQVNASDITVEAATKQERVLLAAQAAITKLTEMKQKVTQTAVAVMTQALGFNDGKGYSQQHVGRFWKLLVLLIEDINSKMSNFDDPVPSGEDAACFDAVIQVLDALPLEQDTSELLESLSDVFLDWLTPYKRQRVWFKVSAHRQIAFLSALFSTLPIDGLNRLINLPDLA